MQEIALTLFLGKHSIAPESSNGFASVGTILPKEKAALLPGGFFLSQGAFFAHKPKFLYIFPIMVIDFVRYTKREYRHREALCRQQNIASGCELPSGNETTDIPHRWQREVQIFRLKIQTPIIVE